MRYDIWRLSGVIFFSGLLGLLTGYLFFCLATGLFVVLVWQHHEFSQLLAWLKKQSIKRDGFKAGLANDVYREVHFLKDRHRARKHKLTGYLRRFREATLALPDAVIVLGRHHEIEWANQKALDYIGVHWPKDAGVRLVNLLRQPELTSYMASVQPGSSQGVQIASPVRNDLILEMRLLPYTDMQQTLLIARDVTDISKANQAQKDFIANASHELRTPLTVIAGYLEGFVDDPVCPLQWKDCILQMNKQALRMKHLLQDLMQLSSLEMGEDSCEQKEWLHVPDILLSIISEARSLQQLNNHNIVLNIDKKLMLMGYSNSIYSIFSNLIFNAVQYTPARGEIRINWSRLNGKACFSIQDNGVGIDKAHLPRLTERFYRADKGRSRKSGGTGLGLAIVKHALARHAADLTIDSELGFGSTFSCWFPAHLSITDK